MDDNPRHFRLHVYAIDVDLNTAEGEDVVEIVYHGRMRPKSLERLTKALDAGHFVTSEKRLL